MVWLVLSVVVLRDGMFGVYLIFVSSFQVLFIGGGSTDHGVLNDRVPTSRHPLFCVAEA